jgi:two-component system NtrC family sensor kinase
MRLQTKFNLVLVIIFVVLAVGIAVTSFTYVTTNSIREAVNRVRIYMRAAWEIHDATVATVRQSLELLAQDQSIRELLADPGNAELTSQVQVYLEAVRAERGMDVLSLLAPDGTVILRTRSPYNRGDSLAADPMVHQAMLTGQSVSGDMILDLQRMDAEGIGLIERCVAVGGEPTGMLSGAAVPIFDGVDLLGIIQMGYLVNGSVDEVDRIRDSVFENELYEGKPLGTATFFMGDLRISTNVRNSVGGRAVGTRVSQEVADRVLGEGLSWTGRAFVVDTWYLSQYDPIRDPEGSIIGILYVGELEQKYLDMRSNAVMTLLLVIGTVMVLAFFVYYFLIRSVLRPILRLSEATDRLSSGDLSYRVEVRGRDEVGALSASFNEMASRLGKQREEIERRQLDLEILSQELQVTNQNYIEMLGFVTHELKNPLTSAIMSLYTVKDGYLGEITPPQKKSLESVALSLDYFHDMIKNYLDLSRLERGELEVNTARVPIVSDVVAPVMEGLGRELQEGQMVVENRVPGGMEVECDPNLLRIVYDNLLSNAIKYGRAGGTILLDAQEGVDSVTLCVRNDGEGLTQEEMAQLFRKFGRLGQVGKKGTGLGLYICREIIEAHGGEIWVDSKLGEWVMFSFKLPS